MNKAAHLDARWWIVAKTGGSCEHIHRSRAAAQRCLHNQRRREPTKQWSITPANPAARDLMRSERETCA